ncbi:LLM class flavin-dependent oxidoreductase [Dietzia sp. ANT_WB102]|uniref:LLM class flavin-dependent oxidoreductase n=1 Tax=Dietzia sp. ANT_WB102 TaxID=2597345 RepID=UPI0011ECF21A|nr:LLM class flavin-dependent oxidoreductase [Dietzia sp. ANT_WB102]KAA0918525.1 LLM class flavin-dependent oxidoreductase [Dietzia sp. ANT_WB102]
MTSPETRSASGTESHSALPLSVIDFATVRPGQSVGEALQDSVLLAQKAEELGYERVWYSEHHNMPAIASSAPAVLMAHIASHTKRIRLGSGGVMLPNHSPIVIAEQFGTLAELHPGRIDLGLGRAPGTDPQTLRALRREPSAAEKFPDDVRELQAFLGDSPTDMARTRGIVAVPGRGTKVPLYILGSSLFGAQLAAAYGLPYAFASHFAPDALEQASAVYRSRFTPSEQLAEPYMIAAVNVVADDDAERAERELHWYRRQRVKLMAGRGRDFSDAELDMIMESAGGRQILHMISNTACGDGPAVRDYLTDFARRAGADELMIAPIGSTVERIHGSLDVLRRAWSD